MTPEELTKQIADIGAELRKEMQAAVDTGKTQETEFKARFADLEKKQNDSIAELRKSLDEQLAAQNRREEASRIITLKDTLSKSFTPEVISTLKSNRNFWSNPLEFPFATKATDPQLVASSTAGVYYADVRPEIKGYSLYVKMIRDLFTVSSTTLNSVDLPSEKSTTDNATAVQTEGSALGTSDLLVDKTNLKVVTIGANVTMSKDSLDDLPAMSAWINKRLTDRLVKAENAQLITGTTYGIYTVAPVADPTNWDISNANYWNILVAAVGEVLYQKNAYPTAILMNPRDLYNKLLAATTTYGFLNPQAIFNGLPVTVAGVPVFASETITAGTFLLGDFSNAFIFQREAPMITFGYNSDDFEKNNISVKVTERLASGTDLSSTFLKGTLATVLACGSA